MNNCFRDEEAPCSKEVRKNNIVDLFINRTKVTRFDLFVAEIVPFIFEKMVGVGDRDQVNDVSNIDVIQTNSLKGIIRDFLVSDFKSGFEENQVKCAPQYLTADVVLQGVHINLRGEERGRTKRNILREQPG